MTQLQTAHTADLDTASLTAIRTFLTVAFDGDFSDDDWEHALGGMHALIRHGDEVIAHGSVGQRRMLVDGRSLRAGYVEAVAVHPDHRRQGHGGTVMAALERIIRGGYDLGMLGASDEGALMYKSRGWQLWTGPLSVITPDGLVRTEDNDGEIYALPVVSPLDLSGPVACDWRHGDVW